MKCFDKVYYENKLCERFVNFSTFYNQVGVIRRFRDIAANTDMRIAEKRKDMRL